MICSDTMEPYSNIIPYEHYDSAHSALMSLPLGTQKINKLHVRKKIQLFAEVFSVQYPPDWKRNNPLSMHINHVFGIRSPCYFTDKSVKFANVEDSDKVIIFSDVYPDNQKSMKNMIQYIQERGVNILPFYKIYQKLTFKDKYKLPDSYNIMYNGYEGFYRGNLVGFIL